jgi:hypothetical protein
MISKTFDSSKSPLFFNFKAKISDFNPLLDKIQKTAKLAMQCRGQCVQKNKSNFPENFVQK